MKLTAINLDIGQVESDLLKLEALLHPADKELSERDDILPFFKAHPHLSAFLAHFSNASLPDRYAHEYKIGGNFACDLLAGDSVENTYAFIEFEDAKAGSIFKTSGKASGKTESRKVPEWSPRLDHGFSQIVDWFYSLDDIKQTRQFRRDFPGGTPSFVGMLVIGRSFFLEPADKARLVWRQDKVLVDSRRVLILTFDELLEILRRKVKIQKLRLAP